MPNSSLFIPTQNSQPIDWSAYRNKPALVEPLLTSATAAPAAPVKPIQKIVEPKKVFKAPIVQSSGRAGSQTFAENTIPETNNEDRGIFSVSWDKKVDGVPEPIGIEQQVNSFRADNKLPSLSASSTLAELAQERANEMAKSGKFTHYSISQPEKSAIGLFMEQNRLPGTEAISENIAQGDKGYIDSERTSDIWENSVTGHKETILDPSWTEFGTAVSLGTFEGKPAYFIVQIFAEPRKPTVQFSGGKIERKSLMPARAIAISRVIPVSEINTKTAVSTPQTLLRDRIFKSKDEPLFMN